MPAPISQAEWPVTYERSPRCLRKTLLCLPEGVQRDMKILAKAKGISMSELVRRSAINQIAEYLREHPEHAASFRGELRR